VQQNGQVNVRVWASQGAGEIISQMNESSFQIVLQSQGRKPVKFSVISRDIGKGTLTLGLEFENPENISANGVSDSYYLNV